MPVDLVLEWIDAQTLVYCARSKLYRSTVGSVKSKKIRSPSTTCLHISILESTNKDKNFPVIVPAVYILSTNIILNNLTYTELIISIYWLSNPVDNIQCPQAPPLFLLQVGNSFNNSYYSLT